LKISSSLLVNENREKLISNREKEEIVFAENLKVDYLIAYIGDIEKCPYLSLNSEISVHNAMWDYRRAKRADF